MQQRAEQTGLLDHLVGAAEQRERDGHTERPGGLKVDDQLHFRGLVDRQISGLLAFKDPAGVDAGLTVRAGTLIASDSPSDMRNSMI